MKRHITPTSVERIMREDDFIVSMTDLKGVITYCNRIFIEFSGYAESELLGTQHNIIRHPDMPRAVFKLLWDKIQNREECFAYVKNMAKNGNFYWVFAHVTPSYDANRNVVGFHSSRRVPDRKVVEKTIVPLYSAILQEEKRHQNGQKELAAGFDFVLNFLKSRNTSYDALIFSL